MLLSLHHRHIGAGLTFALGRLLVLIIGALLHYSSLVDMTVYDNKMTWFYICSYTAAVLSVGGAELLARVAGKGSKGYVSGYSKLSQHPQQCAIHRQQTLHTALIGGSVASVKF